MVEGGGVSQRRCQVSEFKATEPAFKPGDVVAHKADGYQRWVVVSLEGNRVLCSNGDMFHDPHTSSTYPVRVPFSTCELELYVPVKDDHKCCTPDGCSGPCFAAENGQYDEWDDLSPDGWRNNGTPVETDINGADDIDAADPFVMDIDDLPDDDEYDVGLMDIGDLLSDAANRLEVEGFPKLAGIVDMVNYHYQKGDDNGRVNKP